MGYHRIGQAYVTTQEAVRHSATLFGLAVALCIAGASALSAYLLLHDRLFLAAHENLANGVYFFTGVIGFWLGIRYGRRLATLFLIALLMWSIVTAARLYATWSYLQ